MVFKKPYGFLIKHFRLIHLILTGLYIYLAIKVNRILRYYINFGAGIASKLDANNYITSYYIIASLLAIGICLVIYILMRHKKKPRMLYIILILFSFVVALVIQYSYQGLETIYISVLDTKSLRLYQDLLRILSLFQYFAIAVVLVRGLGFDIKKFNFVQDLEELDIDIHDDEEVELTLNGTDSVVRKIRRNVRELKYYYFENKVFINIIVIVILAVGIFSWFFNVQVIHKVYQQNESFSTDEFTFQVLASYITNRGFDNQEIMDDDTSFVVVRMNIGSRSGSRELNTGNLILKVNHHNYSIDKRYVSRFADLGSAYRNQKIDGAETYLFIYLIQNEDISKKMKIVYAEDKTVYLDPVMLDQVKDTKNYSLGETIDLSQSSLGSGSFKVQLLEVQDSFSYPYQYEMGGQIYTNQLSISSRQNTILHLVITSSYPYGLTDYSFLERYAKLYYKVEDKEYSSSAFDDKTPGNYKDGLYLSVDKKILEASNIWFVIQVRNCQYVYTLK